jgi:hypothetical protein
MGSESSEFIADNGAISETLNIETSSVARIRRMLKACSI